MLPDSLLPGAAPATQEHLAQGPAEPMQGGVSFGEQENTDDTEESSPHKNLSNPEPDPRATTCDEGHFVPKKTGGTLKR